MKRPSISVKSIFAGAYLCIGMGATVPLFVGEDAFSPNPAAFIGIWLVLYALTGIQMLIGLGRISRAALVPAIIPVVALFSITWSAAPKSTTQYSLLLIGNFVFCAWMAQHLDVERTLNIILKAVCALVAASIALNLLGLDFITYKDIHERPTLLNTEPIRGLFNHKITAGIYAALGTLIAWKTIDNSFQRIAICLTLIYFLLLTGSSSALAILLIGSTFLFIITKSRTLDVPPRLFAVTSISVISIGAIITISLAPFVLGLLGRDPTLTGRTVLWAWGLEAVKERPITGWGYQAYFESYHAYLHQNLYSQFSNYDVPHFHNSYIQIAADLGLPILILYLALMLLTMLQCYKNYFADSSDAWCVATALVMTMLVAGFFINTFPSHNNFSTLVIFILLIIARRNAKAKKR